MVNNLDITNSNSNNILKTIVTILVVASIAYIVYYLYTKNKNNLVDSEINSEVNNEVNNEVNEYEYDNRKNTRNIIQPEEKINEINFKMNGKLQSNSNPIMKKINMLPSGEIIGQNDIEHFSQNQTFSDERNSSNFPKEQLTAEELLPQDNSSLWAQVNPSGEGSLKDRNFLQSGYHIGINTIGQTLRNANLQLRSEPPCPQVKVSPWLQATIEPDIGRKPFEIGGCA
jgi:hypothetical protein